MTKGRILSDSVLIFTSTGAAQLTPDLAARVWWIWLPARGWRFPVALNTPLLELLAAVREAGGGV